MNHRSLDLCKYRGRIDYNRTMWPPVRDRVTRSFRWVLREILTGKKRIISWIILLWEKTAKLESKTKQTPRQNGENLNN